MPSPFFSIIIPTYNSVRTLQNALDSIYSQSFVDYEILIIDGLSEDGTIERIRENARRGLHTRFISEKDQGVYDAFNKGLRMVSGEWIYFLGSDDRLHHPSVLKIVFDKLQEQHCDLLYGNILFANRSKPYDGPFTVEKLLDRNISHQAIFYNKRVYEQLGGFNTRYKIMADWEFNLKCFFRPGFKEVFLELIIADFATEGISRQMDVLFLREVLIPEILRRMSSPGKGHYLRNISRYDDFWRLLRNANIRTLSELKRYSQELSIPPAFMNMLRHQSKISPGLLKNGFISKTCMFFSYLANGVNRTI
jgi:glycosyltransferase involved in cell wall biosynthesis